MTIGNIPLKQPPPTNHGHISLPQLETYHPQREWRNLSKNRGILNNLRNYDREVRPDTTTAANNISAKTLLQHTPTNQQHV